MHDVGVASGDLEGVWHNRTVIDRLFIQYCYIIVFYCSHLIAVLWWIVRYEFFWKLSMQNIKDCNGVDRNGVIHGPEGGINEEASKPF